MKSLEDMKILLDQLLPFFYSSYVTNPADPVTAESYVPVGCLTYDLFESLKYVLFMEQIMVHKRWEKFIDISCVKMLMLSSNEMYLRYVLFACRYLIKHVKNIFSIFIGVCTLVIDFSIETCKNTGVNYCELSPDIVLAIYNKDVKNSFIENGGFEGLAKFIRGFKVFSGNSERSCVLSSESISDLVWREKVIETFDLMEKTGDCKVYFPESITHNEIISCPSSQFLAIMLMDHLRRFIKFPPLPSSDELKARLRAAMQKKSTKISKRKNAVEVVQKSKETTSKICDDQIGMKSKCHNGSDTTKLYSSLHFDSKSSNELEQEKISCCRGIVQAVDSRTSYKVGQEEILCCENVIQAVDDSKTSNKIEPEVKISGCKNVVQAVDDSKTSNKVELEEISCCKNVVQAVDFKISNKVELEGISCCKNIIQAVDDSKTYHEVDPEEVSWSENVVKAVLQHNSKRAVFEKPVNPNQKKIDEVLKHLKSTIKSLMDALEK